MSHVGSSPGLADGIAAVATGLDVLSRVALADATDGELGDAVLALRRLSARLASLDARVVARFESSGGWATEARTVGRWFTQRANAGEAETRQRRSLARMQQTHPSMAAALVAGAVSVDHLKVLADVHARVPSLHAELDAVEDIVTDYARSATPLELRRFLEQLVLRVEPGAVDERERERLEERARLSVTELQDGWVAVSGLLPPDLGARLLSTLRALQAPVMDVQPSVNGATHEGCGQTESGEADNGQAASGAADGAGPSVALPRPRCRRNVEALGRLLDYASAADLDGRSFPLVRGARPVVHVTVGLEVLSGRVDGDGAMLAPGSGNAVVVTSNAARRLSCDAVVRRLVLDPAGVPIDVGRRQRTIPPGLAVSVQHRDRHCRWPGCRQRIDEHHHVVHWAAGGSTDRRNVIGLCWYHHHLAHDGAWDVGGDADREVTFRERRACCRTQVSRPPGESHLHRALVRVRC